MDADDFLRRLLRCPVCHGDLSDPGSDELTCQAGCGRRYPVVGGIPVLLSSALADGSHKAEQASFFDAADAGWETVRPAGAPQFYRRLLEHKFEQAIAGIRSLLPGATVLTVCGGSGMDAEYLAQAGARVIASDLSLGAARRARKRGMLRDVALTPLVADVEALPFADRSVDIVFVHDGLHHLEDPNAGLQEMARVARVAVSINEPARAVATSIAVRVGFSEKIEEAGNRVQRVDPAEVVAGLEAAGLKVVRNRRYAMLYRHEPGPVSSLLSVTPLRQLAEAALSGFNLGFGSVGNKLTVQAVRPPPR